MRRRLRICEEMVRVKVRRLLRILAVGLAVLAVGMVGLPLAQSRADTVSSTIPVGASPRVVAVAPNGKIFIADRPSAGQPSEVTVINPATDTAKSIPVGVELGAVHIGTDGRVYVPDRVGNTVVVLDSSTDTITHTIPINGLRPASVDTPDDNSKVVVANERSGSVTVLNGADLTEIATLPVAPSVAPHTVAVSPNGAKAYIACEATNEVLVIDLAGPVPAIAKRIPVGLGPGSLRFVGSSLFVANQKSSSVSVIDTNTDTVTATANVGGAPHGLVDTPDSSRVLVANEASGTVSVLSASGGVIGGEIAVGARPQRIHITDDGRRAYVPNEDSGTVSVIDLSTLQVIDTITVGSGPTSLDIANGKVYVANLSSNNVSVITIQEPATAPPPSNTPEATSTPRPTHTPVPVASATPVAVATALPGDTPAPAAPAAPDDSGSPAPDGAVAGMGVTPPDGAAQADTPQASPTGTPTKPATSPAARATSPGGSIAQPTGSTGDASPAGQPEDSGGAPSWIWLALGLGVLALLGGGGYAFRNQLAVYLARLRR
jgi:YVTN family beta-propeller protein